ncbi:MAG: tRNA 2-thiouridine(34) synthase MnmA [Deltaproteobacteria bacterium]|nr:tRNA 2-thiouridine(34) synthase MnmA [Deltaproteobacteria bacterium]
MSGGVDSSVAAALLAESGADAIGVTMRLSESGSRCCSLEDADDARRVAQRLGIRFYVANYARAFGREVIEEFADAYLSGRTPIPCVTCNKRFKFDHLLDRAKVFGATRVATGHYARLSHAPETGQARMYRGLDRDKDQSYFLFSLDQAQLRAACFPIGELSKDEVRQRARDLGLATADKRESQEICFVPDGDYAKVVERLHPGASALRGEIVDESGRVLGEHCGVHRFTVGQRHGLGISADRRLYVVSLDPRCQRVVVGEARDLDCGIARVEQVNWISGRAPGGAIRARVQVRHRHRAALAEIEPIGVDAVEVRFDEPVRAVAPGQAAVFYDATQDREVFGGGWLAGGLP